MCQHQQVLVHVRCVTFEPLKCTPSLLQRLAVWRKANGGKGTGNPPARNGKVSCMHNRHTHLHKPPHIGERGLRREEEIGGWCRKASQCFEGLGHSAPEMRPTDTASRVRELASDGYLRFMYKPRCDRTQNCRHALHPPNIKIFISRQRIYIIYLGL
jgi:hypothetical protein